MLYFSHISICFTQTRIYLYLLYSVRLNTRFTQTALQSLLLKPYLYYVYSSLFIPLLIIYVFLYLPYSTRIYEQPVIFSSFLSITRFVGYSCSTYTSVTQPVFMCPILFLFIAFFFSFYLSLFYIFIINTSFT